VAKSVEWSSHRTRSGYLAKQQNPTHDSHRKDSDPVGRTGREPVTNGYEFLR
jgi:hypothetical protein